MQRATRRRRRPAAGNVFLAALLSLAAAPALALDVQNVQWGFDGRVLVGRFNPLTVYVYNPDRDAFAGALILHKEGVTRLGAELIEPCFLAPQTGRWVTFYPYITSEHDEWKLRWGRGRGQRIDLGSPTPGEPVVVFMEARIGATRTPPGLRAFDAQRFPTAPGATDGLRAAILDTVPDWDAARRKAFMDWLRGGGELHILANPGEPQEFPPDMGDLNTPLPAFHIGGGIVHRHAFSRGELTEEHRSVMGLKPRPPTTEGDRSAQPFTRPLPLEQVTFRRLEQLERPQHNWWVIYLATLAFMALIGPVNWWLSRRRVTWRGSLTIVLVSVAGFSWAFFIVGKRGYGSHSTVHKLAVARHLGEGRYDTTQYISVFVTRGGQYQITHPADHNLYATAHAYESVRGQIAASGGGAFIVDIPIFSFRSFVHRGTFTAPAIEASLAQWPHEGLGGLVVEIGEGFPSAMGEIWAVHQRHVVRMRRQGDQLVPVGAPQEYTEALGLTDTQQAQYYDPRWGYDPFGAVTDLAKAVEPIIGRIIAHELGVFVRDAPAPPTRPDQIALFVLAEAPAEFGLPKDLIGLERGYVLYHLTLTQPDDAKTPLPPREGLEEGETHETGEPDDEQ